MNKKDVSIVLCGAAGQGVQTVENILVRLLRRAGFHVFATKEYMSRIRGGSNSTEIRISSERVSAPVDRIDLLLPFHPDALNHLKTRISPETTVIGDRKNICLDCPAEVTEFIDIPFAEIAEEIGGKLFINIIAAGVILGMLDIDMGMVSDFISSFFAKKDEGIVRKNIEAVKLGCQRGKELLESGKARFALKNPSAKNELLLNGAETVGMGALAGGCDFLSSYPMSPSTGVMTFLSQQMENFGVVVEQAEDEIAAINMALGGSYAGARTMVTTSGGGFALMTEGVSLSGMIETPVVVHIAQRPGPATGLPTRTEQADLELVLYAGHGEFPRIIFAPGTLQDAFFLTQNAFNLADKYQIPVFILTDQYFMDSFTNIPPFDLDGIESKRHIVKTKKDYKRYVLTEDGISPRGIPGFGDGLVGVDSDEHDEESHITEDLELRTRMVDKRLKKMDLILSEIVPPEFLGSEDYEILLVGWGSTYHVLKEALAEFNSKDIALLHFKQVYPLHPGTKDFIEKAKRTIFVENNATSQFGRIVKLNTGYTTGESLLKYNGLPFTVEDIVEGLKKKLS
ncbi:MAG: 2-oxoacid:acceptor oxidoreductase subunit alpha [Candidatus Aminicenantaceae bacterium]